MSMRGFEGMPGPAPGGMCIVYISPGGIACEPYADGYLTMRVCLGHVHHAEDGLIAELGGRDSTCAVPREPIPWQSQEVREEVIEQLRHRANRAEGDGRRMLIRLLEHVRRTPFYEDI